jgi:hypothetical protein
MISEYILWTDTAKDAEQLRKWKAVSEMRG